MNTKIKKIITKPAIVCSVIVAFSLSYYTYKFYSNAELIFNKNQFDFFLAFAIVVLFLIFVLTYFMLDSRKMIIKLVEKNKKIDTIEEMLNILIEQCENHLDQSEYQFHQIINSEKIIKELIFDMKR